MTSKEIEEANRIIFQCRQKIRQLDLRWALEDFDDNIYTDRQSSEVGRLVAFLTQLHPNLSEHTSQILWAAMPSEKPDKDLDDVCESVDDFLYGSLSSDALAAELQETRVRAERRRTTVAFGVICDGEKGLQFIEIIPPSQRLPIRREFSQKFRPMYPSQRSARILLACRATPEGQPTHFDAVEFSLGKTLRAEDVLTITLRPRSDWVGVVLECRELGIRKEAMLQFAPRDWSETQGSVPTEQLIAGLQKEINRVMGLLREGSNSVGDDEIEKNRRLLSALLNASKALQTDTGTEALRHAYNNLRGVVGKIGEAAQGFLHHALISEKVLTLDKEATARQITSEAEDAHAQLRLASAEGNVRKQKFAVKRLSDLALRLTLQLAQENKFGAASLDFEHLGISAELWQHLRQRAGDLFKQEQNLLSIALADTVDATATIVWLWLVTLGARNLRTLLRRMFRFPLASFIDAQCRKSLLKLIRRSTRKSGIESYWRPCREFVALTRRDLAAKSCSACAIVHKVVNSSRTRKPFGKKLRYESSAMMKTAIEAWESGRIDEQRLTAEKLWRLAVEAIARAALPAEGRQDGQPPETETSRPETLQQALEVLVGKALHAVMSDWHQLLCQTKITKRERENLRWLSLSATAPHGLAAAFEALLAGTTKGTIDKKTRTALKDTLQTIHDTDALMKMNRLHLFLAKSEIEREFKGDEIGPSDPAATQPPIVERYNLLRPA